MVWGNGSGFLLFLSLVVVEMVLGLCGSLLHVGGGGINNVFDALSALPATGTGY